MAARELCDRNWYAARSHCGREVGVRDRLSRLGVENFVPTEIRSKTRGGNYEKALIPCLVFLKATKEEACSLANTGMVPVKYVVDCATRSLLVVPDKEMEDFRRVLDFSKESGGLMEESLSLGDKVRVTKGVLCGVEGHVLEFRGKTYVVVGLLDCVFAKAEVPRAWL